MLTITICTVCKVAKTTLQVCSGCKRRAAKKGTRKQAQTANNLRSSQENKEDEIAIGLPIQARMEHRPCRRCGRLVIVQAIPEEERRKLRTLPVAVECEKPCEMRSEA